MRLLSVILLLLATYSANAQVSIDDRMAWYHKKQEGSSLFVHYDKNIYSYRETIWFTAYGLDEKLMDTVPSILTVTLVRNADDRTVLHRKFLFDNGTAYGNINVPDTILTGSYRLIAYHNTLKNGLPTASFVQPVVIKTGGRLPMNLNVQQRGVKDKPGQTNLSFMATNKNNSFFAKPVSISYRYGDISNKVKTDVMGQFAVDLPLQPKAKDPTLNVLAVFEKDTAFVTMALKVKPRKASIKFYPEGGALVDKISSVVGFEINDQYGSPVEASAILYKDDIPADTLNSAVYGLGKFTLNPRKDSRYTVKIVHQDIADSVYVLPPVLDDGLVINTVQALAKDTLRAQLRTNRPKSVILRVHNFRQTFALTKIDIGRSKQIAIPLAGMPKGIATITVSDSAGRPLAERMCFFHFDNQKPLRITTDTTTYKPRQEVTLRIKLADSATAGIVSVAGVQANRINLRTERDIRDYTYLEREIAELPLPELGGRLENTNYLENFLIVRGWRKYKWLDMLQVKPEDTVAQRSKLLLTGNVTRYGKVLTDSVEVILANNNGLTSIITHTDGSFFPTVADLLTSAEKKLLVYVNVKNRLPYDFKINDPFLAMNNKLPALYPYREAAQSDLVNNFSLVLPVQETGIKIEKVDIVAKTASDHFGNYNRDCPDWVCVNKIFNCKNHGPNAFGSTTPITGQRYFIDGVSKTYPGCKPPEPNSNFTDGISLAKEFYADKYSDLNEPAYFSTIYWNHAVPILKNKEAILKFHTGDITGKFRVVVQGITDGDVVSGSLAFEVVK